MADEAVSQSGLVADTFGRGAEYYDRSPFFPMAGRRLVELAQIEPGARVLDVASGTGAVLFPAAERAGAGGRVIGIDLADQMVAKTAGEIRRRGLAQAEIRRMNAEALAFDDASFDCVTCGFALWFIPDLAGALSEMRRVLRPGGRLVVSTSGPPNELSREYNKLLERYGGPIPNLSSHTLTSAEAVRAVLQEVGFTVTYVAEEMLRARFASAEQWWAERMVCPQVYFEALPPEQQAQFKAEVLAMLDASKAPDGSINESRTAVFASALKPA